MHVKGALPFAESAMGVWSSRHVKIGVKNTFNQNKERTSTLLSKLKNFNTCTYIHIHTVHHVHIHVMYECMYVLYVCPKRKPRSCSVSPLAILQLEFQFFF